MNNKKYLILIPIIIIFLFVISILLPSEIWSNFVDIFTIKLDMNFDYLFRSSYMPV